MRVTTRSEVAKLLYGSLLLCYRVVFCVTRLNYYLLEHITRQVPICKEIY